MNWHQTPTKSRYSTVHFIPSLFWIQIIDEVILEIEGKMISYVPGKIDDALLGANASAEGGDEGVSTVK